jgi:uncharacterized MAPEG superfamily protein
MTFAYWCVLAAALMPLLWAGAAKSRRDFDNASPRDWLAGLEGWRRRANAAQLNSWEAFAPFAAAVIIAHLAGAAQGRVDILAGLFVAARLGYGILYIADRPTLRSVAWTVAMGCVVGLFAVSA